MPSHPITLPPPPRAAAIDVTMDGFYRLNPPAARLFAASGRTD
ncbi:MULTISPECIES: hypothetical protein [Cyanophyceae]|nr:hypothetical protein [Phormidium sp. FACHB-592]